MAVRPEAGVYYSPGCEESNELKFFEEEPARFIPFSVEFIIPGRFYLGVEGSQVLESRFDFLISDSDLVLISVGQRVPFHECGPFYFFHSTVNNNYYIFKDRNGREFLHPKFRFLSPRALRSTVTGVYRFKKKTLLNARNAVPVSVTPPPVAAAPLPSTMMTNVPANNPTQPIKRRPGRPSGSGKKPTPVLTATMATPALTATMATPAAAITKRGPGRPPGSGKTQRPPQTIQTANPVEGCREPPAKRRKSTPVKLMELSVTISIAGCDISPTLFPVIQAFLQSQCEACVFAVERGGSLLNLHLQGVIAMVCSSAVDAKKRITSAIE
ncbi:hypothetical protein R1sor_008071 [Riccia sorocarpa]|uniref:Uncharacterized protein n=1 Tax=Riccia sorocarpa TaxID=122646 RepID=A0ABD3HVX0_9MARC